MAPLQCASVSDLYGTDFGLSPEQIAQKTLKNNQECAEKNLQYQNNLKQNQIAGKSNFQENFNKSNPGNLENNLIPPNYPPPQQNNTQFAKRPAWTNVDNTWPSNQGINMFNRFQNIFGTREDFTLPGTDSECLRRLVSLATSIELILKIIMFVLILLFIIKLLEKKN